MSELEIQAHHAKDVELRAHLLKDLTLPEIIQLEIDSAEFWMEEDIYPDEVREEEQGNIDRLRRLQKRKQFSAADVHFLLQRVAGSCESNCSLAEFQKRLNEAPVLYMGR